MARRESSVQFQLQQQLNRNSMVLGAPVSDSRALHKELDMLKRRVVELEQGAEARERDFAVSRHMAALFEEYVQTATSEGAAMLQSHSTLKSQMISSERLIALLAEKVVTMVSSTANKIKEFEEVQIGHQQKLVDLDTKQKEMAHKINQLKHASSGSHTPRMKRRPVGGGGGDPLGVGESPGYGSTHFAADSHSLDGAVNHSRLEGIEAAVAQSRQVIMDQLRETKLEVDSVWGEIRRDNDLNKKRFSELESSIADLRLSLTGSAQARVGSPSSPSDGKGERRAVDKLRSSVHKINALNAFARRRMTKDARKSVMGGEGGGHGSVSPERLMPRGAVEALNEGEEERGQEKKARTSSLSDGGGTFSFG